MAGHLAVALVELAPIGRRAVRDGGRIPVGARPAAAKHRRLGRPTGAQQLIVERPQLGLVASRDDRGKIVGRHQRGAAPYRLGQ